MKRRVMIVAMGATMAALTGCSDRADRQRTERVVSAAETNARAAINTLFGQGEHEDFENWECPTEVYQVIELCGWGDYMSTYAAQWSGCGLVGGGAATGGFDYTSTNTLAPDGATCEDAVSLLFQDAWDYANVSTHSDGGTRETASTWSGSGSHPLFEGSSEVPTFTYVGSSLDRTTDAAGTVTEEITFTGDETVTYEYGESSVDAKIDGTFDLAIAPESSSFVATLNALSWTFDYETSDACCHPTGGGITLVDQSDSQTHEVTFGPGCGEAALDGAAITLPVCNW